MPRDSSLSRRRSIDLVRAARLNLVGSGKRRSAISSAVTGAGDCSINLVRMAVSREERVERGVCP